MDRKDKTKIDIEKLIEQRNQENKALKKIIRKITEKKNDQKDKHISEQDKPQDL
jgi:hypothetical protein